MTIWTVMFGDDPLGDMSRDACRSARVWIFNSRRTAYAFKNFCRTRALHADVVHHPYRPSNATLY